MEQSPTFGEQVRQMRHRMLTRGDSLITSALTVGELLMKPTRDGNEALAQQYLAIFSRPAITVLGFDLDVAGLYARIRHDKSIDPPDAIQLATAALAGVDLFITNDDRLSRKLVPGIKFITSLARAPI